MEQYELKQETNPQKKKFERKEMIKEGQKRIREEVLKRRAIELKEGKDKGRSKEGKRRDFKTENN